MISIDLLKEYFWYIFGVIGVVFFWIGVWDGVGYLPYLENPWLSLVLGFTLLTVQAVVFRKTNPLWGEAKKVKQILHGVHTHPEKHTFHIKYTDHVRRHELKFSAKKIKSIEKDFLILVDRGQEWFIPFHRVTEILHNGTTHWKA